MIHEHQATPPEYLYALDVAIAWLAPFQPGHILDHTGQLEAEIQARSLAHHNEAPRGAIWIEPQTTDWRARLLGLQHDLPAGNRLIVILLLPVAGWLYRDAGRRNQFLGLGLGGRTRLLSALSDAGFRLEREMYINTGRAILFNTLAGFAGRLGRRVLADRFHYMARKRFVGGPAGIPLAACAVLDMHWQPIP